MGFLRFSMMIAVVYYHIAWLTMSGYMAVFGFFVISGYVITMAVAEVYGATVRGKLLFLQNRAIRLYPVYLASIAFSLLCMWYTGFTTQQYHKAFTLPDEPLGWLVQFTIIGQSNATPERYPARILPPAWSLATEMVYYLIIGLITGCSRKATLLAFIAAWALAVYMYLSGLTFKYFYLTLYGPAFAFFSGACAYHFRAKLRRIAALPFLPAFVLANIVLFAPNFVTWPGAHVFTPVFFVGVPLLTWLVLNIQQSKPFPPKVEFLDRLTGDITYPVFLIHWPVAAVLSLNLYGRYTDRNHLLFFLTLIVSIAIGITMIFAIERPLKVLRRRNREKAMRS